METHENHVSFTVPLGAARYHVRRERQIFLLLTHVVVNLVH